MAALPEGFLIRVAGPEDVAAIAAMEAEAFPDPWPYHLYSQEVNQPLRFNRVILSASGFLVAYLFSCWQADELHVLKVATHPLYQSQGLATALLGLARDEAVKSRSAGIILEVRPSNRRAFQVYRRLGYAVLGRRPRYYADGEDALVMFLGIPTLHASRGGR